jgi:isoleucyl-tRNA synthetase
VANSDYYDDLRIGKEIIQRQVDHYRRLRNTLRYLLGSLNGFAEAEKVDIADMPQLERWVLMRLKELDIQIRAAAAEHDYHHIFTLLHHFCNNDLSAFYFDIRKDMLYCGDTNSNERRACRTVMDTLFNTLVVWLAPILTFTAEEAWQTRYPDPDDSVHFAVFPDLPEGWLDEELATRWARIRTARLAVTRAIEKARNNGVLKSSLQAHPTLHAPDVVIAAFDGLNAADIFITSDATLIAGMPPVDAHIDDDDLTTGVTIALADGDKCDRCWKILPELNEDEHKLCGRCHDVLAG